MQQIFVTFSFCKQLCLAKVHFRLCPFIPCRWACGFGGSCTQWRTLQHLFYGDLAALPGAATIVRGLGAEVQQQGSDNPYDTEAGHRGLSAVVLLRVDARAVLQEDNSLYSQPEHVSTYCLHEVLCLIPFSSPVATR